MKATPAQHAMWLNERLGIAGAVYHMPMSIELSGPLDRDRLTQACAAVVARHPALSHAFTERDGVLWIQPARHPPKVVFEPYDAPSAAAAPFDLEHGPLIRFSLASSEPDRHLLRIVAHHLVFDGPSKDILLHDLADAYNGLPAGLSLEPAVSPRPAVSPGPTVSELRNEIVAPATLSLRGTETHPAAEPAAEPDERLLPAEVQGDLRLPGLHGVATRALPGEYLDFTVTAEHPALTRFEVLLAALVALLVRYGNPEPAIAIDLGTRSPAEADDIGLFVNELPLPAKVHGGQTADRFLTEIRRQLRQLYELRTVALQGPPRLAVAPVSISYRKRGAEPDFDGLTAEVEWMGFHGWARNALHVQMVDDSHTVRIRFQYAPAQLRRADVERMAMHYRKLLTGLGDSSETAVADVPMLTAGELTGLAGPVRDYPVARIEEQVGGTGVAVSCSGQDMSYVELEAAAEAIALRLRDRGVRPGDRVAVRMSRSPELIAALLGVWKAGAAYVPLDPGHPPARQSLLLSDARPRAVVTSEEVIRLEWSGAPEPELAYVIYTSGSTGRPKGVEVTHRSVSNLLHAMREVLELPARPVWLAVASFAFDMSVPEIWLPLTMGGTVVLATQDETRDGERLLKLIRAKAVTHVHVTPTTWQRLLEAGFDEPGVVAISGAEALPSRVAQQVRSRCAGLWNLYGPTETTVWSTFQRVDDSEVTIGRPLPNTTVKIVDESMRPVPQGVPGELCIGGAGVALGYLGQPELTAQRFVDGWYRTGDRVRLRHDGQLEWLGRLDNQIKIRGYRIELGEVEARLLEHPGIRAAAAATHDDETLVAYVVGDAPDLREHMAESLPAYQVPAKFVFLPELPLNPNGKLDRARLPKPPPKPELQEWDPVARQIYEVWCEVLGRRDFGPDDDLFDLGGHSLTVTRIAARMRRRLGIDLPLHVFFDTPTIGGLVHAAASSPPAGA